MSKSSEPNILLDSAVNNFLSMTKVPVIPFPKQIEIKGIIGIEHKNTIGNSVIYRLETIALLNAMA